MLGTAQSTFVPPTSMWNPMSFLGGTQPLPTLPPPLIHPQHQALQGPMIGPVLSSPVITHQRSPTAIIKAVISYYQLSLSVYPFRTLSFNL